MSKDQNVAAQEAFGGAVNSDSLDQLTALVGPGDVDHDPAPHQGPGAQGFQDMFAELRTAFPDLHIEVEHLTATEDDVAFAYTVTGTHQGPLQGHAATGKAFTMRGVQLGRFENGLLVERSDSTDQLGMMTQLGLA